MLKATSVDSIGRMSGPESLEVNDAGYVLLTERADAVAYHLYAPSKGFEERGPWYLKRVIPRREAKQARYTMSAIYDDSELLPLMSPPNDPWSLTLPEAYPDQEYWMVCGGSGRPIAIVECPHVC